MNAVFQLVQRVLEVFSKIEDLQCESLQCNPQCSLYSTLQTTLYSLQTVWLFGRPYGTSEIVDPSLCMLLGY